MTAEVTKQLGLFDSERELLCGWMHKQDHQQFSKQFKRRYWVLHPSRLEYYREEDRRELLKTIPMGEILDVASAFEQKLSKYEGELHLRVAEGGSGLPVLARVDLAVVGVSPSGR